MKLRDKESARKKAVHWMMEEIRRWDKSEDQYLQIKGSSACSYNGEVSICILEGNSDKMEVSFDMGEYTFFFKTKQIYDEAKVLADGQLSLL